MADMISPNFSVSEMSCCFCGIADRDSEFKRILQELRNEVGPLRISSEFRYDAHNERVNKIKMVLTLNPKPQTF